MVFVTVRRGKLSAAARTFSVRDYSRAHQTVQNCGHRVYRTLMVDTYSVDADLKERRCFVYASGNEMSSQIKSNLTNIKGLEKSLIRC